MKKILPKQLFNSIIKNPLRSFILGFLTIFFVPFFLGHYLPLIKENSNLKGTLSSCMSDKSNLESANKICQDKLSATQKSEGKNDVKGISSSFNDFIRDWNYSPDFYIPTEKQLLCPRTKGGRNYQRIYYKKDIYPKNAKLYLKFRMLNENERKYTQHFVIGLADDKNILTELDIPTRVSEGQTMSLRESSESGVLVPRSPGISLKSAIEEGSVINLTHEIQSNVGRLVTQTTALNFVSQYGSEDDKFPTYDKELEDANPSNLPLKLFIGSYVGGCFQILDWSLTF